ncbi:MAPEG family protein [Sphingobium subterraneum]|uniref:MAPEG family protein n=1 Tax=Sphingobium subterraneum TaxID=627688 RepID=A0A841J3L2_9SPHN|nr:MAPEG family protein [Sphingobium subterraneum]MBB6123185.1 hypothetical protein [Sphingobium subterraneum]
MQTAIFWPAFALVSLTYGVWLVMYVGRIALIKRQPPTDTTFATQESSLRYFQPVEMPANNLANLFEMPVLFFAVVILLMVTGQANGLQVALAWTYVALRAVHSAIHIRKGPIPARFLVYVASCAVLLAMWVGLAVDIARAG